MYVKENEIEVAVGQLRHVRDLRSPLDVIPVALEQLLKGAGVIVDDEHPLLKGHFRPDPRSANCRAVSSHGRGRRFDPCRAHLEAPRN